MSILKSIKFRLTVWYLIGILLADGALSQRLGPNVRFSNIEEMVQQALFGESGFLTATTTEGQEVRLYAAPFNLDSRTRIAVIVGRLTREIQDMLSLCKGPVRRSASVRAVPPTGWPRPLPSSRPSLPSRWTGEGRRRSTGGRWSSFPGMGHTGPKSAAISSRWSARTPAL